MRKALGVFEDNISKSIELSGLYRFLQNNVAVPMSFDDLLRAQLVYCVSAFDKLLHDIIRIGITEMYSGTRVPTEKYMSETISIEFHGSLNAASIPPAEYLFDREVVRKLRYMSYQDPTKLADGLSYIWSEPHKWEKIASGLGLSAKDAKTRLRLIVSRRNSIVHESDMDPFSSNKAPMSEPECKDMTEFLLECGKSIVSCLA